MKHTTEDLLLAAKTRELAQSLRRNDFNEAERQWRALNPPPPAYTPPFDLSGAFGQQGQATPSPEEKAELQRASQQKQQAHHERSAAFEDDWYAQRPLKLYAKRALELITEFADELKELRAR